MEVSKQDLTIIEGYIKNGDLLSAVKRTKQLSGLGLSEARTYVNEFKNIDKTRPQKISSSGSGCYVATCVYGSYDCPQVWTLRRYRDNTLAATWYGRAFIHTYYAVSPTIVKWFGNTQWFKKLCKNKLDKMVATLRSNGVEDTPYQDKDR